MDIEKLIDTLKQHGVSCVRSYGKYCSICDEAATALSTLQAENEKLRDELERTQQGQCAGCSVPVVNAESLMDLQDAPKLRAELEKVKAERDALKIYFDDLSSKPDCNTCAKKRCEYKPRVGQTVRANCPLWSGPEKED